MARTLQQLQTMIRRRLGWPSTDSFVTDAELRDMLQESQRELHDFLISTFGNEYRLTTTTLAISASVDRAATTGISRIWRVACRFDSRSRPFRRQDLENGLQDLTAQSWSIGTDLQLRVEKLQEDTYLLLVYPTPSTAQVLRVVGTLAPGTFSVSTAVNTCGYDEYLALDVMAKCKVMEDSDAGVILAKKERLEQRIQENVQPLNAGQPLTITDARMRAAAGGPY